MYYLNLYLFSSTVPIIFTLIHSPEILMVTTINYVPFWVIGFRNGSRRQTIRIKFTQFNMVLMRELEIGINANYYLSNVNGINLEYGIISLSPFSGVVLNLRLEGKKQSVEFVGLVMHIYNRRINKDFCSLMTFFLLLLSKLKAAHR